MSELDVEMKAPVLCEFAGIAPRRQPKRQRQPEHAPAPKRQPHAIRLTHQRHAEIERPEPLAQQPDPAQYVGTYARPTNTVVVRSEGARIIVQDHQSSGRAGAEMPIAFFGPDRAVIIDGTDRGQSIEFVRDANGRVMWVRVVGRVAVRTQ